MFRQLVKRLSHPLLKRSYQLYASRERRFSKSGMTITILPGVFHPGMFLSTQLLRQFLSNRDLKGLRVLELGAGSGFLSFYMAGKKGAIVTASDISQRALKGLHLNVEQTGISIEIIESDLFDHLDICAFDLIVINPPYYPKEPSNEAERAFYCGADFTYFQKLFSQLAAVPFQSECLLILSEDCDRTHIGNLARSSGLDLAEVHRERKVGEWNFIYQIQSL